MDQPAVPDVLVCALRYARAGYRVMPLHRAPRGHCSCGDSSCDSPGKHPRTKNGSHDATTNEATIRDWWTRWPDANIGMTLSGLVAVDVDPRNGGDIDSLPHSLPDTCHARTGGGGDHYLFRARNGTKYPGTLGPGIDCKSGPGAYLVVEPSEHATGQGYVWLDETEPWTTRPAEAPEWLVKAHKSNDATRADGSVTLLQNVADGNSLHDSLRDLAARYVAMGLRFGEICAILKLAMHQSAAPRDQRWQERFADIAHLVHSAMEKYSRAGPTQEARFDPEAARIGDVFETPSPPPRFLVEGHLPFNVGCEDGTGGISKSTRHQWEHIHLLFGMALYGRSVLAPGPSLVITKEDSRDDYRFRYQQIGIAMDLTPVQRRALNEIRVEDLAGTGCRLANSDTAGNLVATDLAENLVKAYSGSGLALVDIDPLVFFSPGERFVNDGASIVLEIGRFISKELSCCVRFTSHVSKEAARGRFVDAHAGRGGSAGGDNARFVHVVVHHDPADEKQFPRPQGVTEESIAMRRILRLHVPKVSGAAPIVDPIWVERDGFMFRHLEAPPATEDQREAADIARLKDFLADELRRGIKHTRNSLEPSLDALKLSRNKLRRALLLAEQRGHIVATDLPVDERHGSKKQYLRPVGLAE